MCRRTRKNPQIQQVYLLFPRQLAPSKRNWNRDFRPWSWVGWTVFVRLNDEPVAGTQPRRGGPSVHEVLKFLEGRILKNRFMNVNALTRFKRIYIFSKYTHVAVIIDRLRQQTILCTTLMNIRLLH